MRKTVCGGCGREIETDNALFCGGCGHALCDTCAYDRGNFCENCMGELNYLN